MDHGRLRNSYACKECIWFDQCFNDEICEHFSPIDDLQSVTYDDHIRYEEREWFWTESSAFGRPVNEFRQLINDGSKHVSFMDLEDFEVLW